MLRGVPEAKSPYVDDTENVPPGSVVIRRVFRNWIKWGTDETPLPATAAFQFYKQDMAARAGSPGPAFSVFLQGHDQAPSLAWLTEEFPGDGFLLLEADFIRDSVGLGIQPWCTREDHHPAHAIVFRPDGGAKVPGSIQARLAQHGQWLYLPEPP